MAEENSRIGNIFAKVGYDHGYNDVTAEFAAFRDFKVKWTRSYKWASFEVSDYLDDAPDSVIESLANTIFEKIKGNPEAGYGDGVVDWITSDRFVDSLTLTEWSDFETRCGSGRNDEKVS